jgi:hypothetical protein
MNYSYRTCTFAAVLLLAGAYGCRAQDIQAPKITTTIATPSGPRQLHAPETQEGKDTTPRVVKWVEPQPLRLPTAETLTTITVKGQTYDIKHIASGSKKSGDEATAAAPRAMIALYDKADEALYFRGSGRGGLESKERLVIEDCTFVIDFQEGDFETYEPRRCAVFVEGFREVLVRN